jgi:hypothetical protein
MIVFNVIDSFTHSFYTTGGEVVLCPSEIPHSFCSRMMHVLLGHFVFCINPSSHSSSLLCSSRPVKNWPHQ